jgi:hypothetical protein
MSVRRPARLLLTAALAAGPLLLMAAPASAVGERPVAYINPDKGMPTENPNVAATSECETPIQADTQPLGNESDGTGNVHVDACLFDAANMRVDTRAAFTVSGVGVISACPDPDKEGPQTSMKVGNSCVLSNFEAANSEYHVRVVSGTAGQQTVDFCADPEGDGCANAEQTSTVRITWGAPTGGVAAGGFTTGGSNGGGLPAAPVGIAVAAFVAAGGALTVARRSAGARR